MLEFGAITGALGMRRGYQKPLFMLLLFLTAIPLMPPRVAGFHYIHIWRVNYSGSLEVTGNQSYAFEPLWQYVDNTSWQTSEQRVFSLMHNDQIIEPLDILPDTDGNLQMILNLTSPLEPNDALEWDEEWIFTVTGARPPLPQISIEQAANRTEIQDIMSSDDYILYTSGTPLWKTNNVTLIDHAREIQQGLPEIWQENSLALVLASVAWIHTNIQKPQDFVEPQYPEELLASQLGDCDDQSNLLIVLLRILGIPSYLQTGHWYKEGSRRVGYLWGSAGDSGYLLVNWYNVLGHGWAMVFIPPWGWLPFDLTVANLDVDPLYAYTKSLYANEVPLVNLWKCISSDYIGSRRMEQQDLFSYQLHRVDTEIWTTLGSIPILDLSYFMTNSSTIIALVITLLVLICLVRFGIRRQSKEDKRK